METAKKAKAVKQPTKKTAEKADTPSGKLLAAVRIRGEVRVNTVFVDTLNMLRLFRKHACIVLQDTPANRGMLQKVKDYITYGEVSSETISLLSTKRKKDSTSSKAFTVFRLNPPRGGFERKGIKLPFTQGGVLGYRGEKINTLIQKML
ncbi:50S ribosomal protein L30 [Candidatus Woesearchaeota archaeon]|nr:MAG: 50S ribosomal protein L30 [Candidatus Woesearchaeota archaeon]